MQLTSPVYCLTVFLTVLTTTALSTVSLAAPDSPTALSGTLSFDDGTAGTITLTWQPPANIDPADSDTIGFNVYRNNQYLTTVFNAEYTGPVDAGERYVWQVAAFAGSPVEFSSLSQPVTLPEAAPDTTPPSVPTQLTGDINADTGATRLTWEPSVDNTDNATGVSGYNVYRDSRYFTTVFEPQLTTQIAPGDRFSWSIVAFDNSNNFSAQSASLTLPDTASNQPAAPQGPLAAPQLLTGQLNEGSDQLLLSWQDATPGGRTLGFNVYRDEQYITTVFETTYAAALNANRNSLWHIVAFDNAQNFSGRSNIYTANAIEHDPLSPPEAPTGLTGSYTANGEQAVIALSWEASIDNAGTIGYNVYENNQYITTVQDTSYTTQVTAGLDYSYTIVAFDADNNFSAQSERTTLPEGANRPPFFEPSGNPVFFAGGTVEVVVAPRDIDGDVPGLYTGGLPEGMQLLDNFDGTRTLFWRPLQPQVGDYAIQVFAIDAQDPTLQIESTITFSVALPDDLSSIPNLPPGINLIEPHVVRIGDSVTMEVRGTDPNGTIPDLVLLNPPEGSTFTDHPEFPSVKVLTWQTDASDFGDYTLSFKAYDTLDPSLEASMSVSISVRDPADFVLPGERLRQLAEQKNIQIGYASVLRYYTRPDNALYQDIVSNEFNLVTPENSMKWGYVNPEPGVFRFEAADTLMNFAAQHGMAVHGHTLVWYSSLPQWVQTSAVDDRESIMLSFIDTMTTRYPGVAIWDVVNEAFEDDGTFRNSVWFEAMGERHIDRAFQHTKERDSDAVLIYNDYDIAWGGPKTDAVYNLMARLLSEGVPVDGIGFQLHIDTDFTRFDEVRETFERFAALGLSIYITELDVGIVNGGNEATQASIMGNIASLCVEQPACRALQLWGITDRYSWRRDVTPLPLDENYQPKPAYGALQQALSD